ncbi:hypothetical protein Tco_0336895 [Tanacetum coccineum]
MQNMGKVNKQKESPCKKSLLKRLWRRILIQQEELKQRVKEPEQEKDSSIPRKAQGKDNKLEEDAEKDELKGFLDIVPREEAPIEVESISTKFPIMDWKTCVLTETFILVKERFCTSGPEGFDLLFGESTILCLSLMKM